MDLHRLQQQLELNLSSIDAEGQTLEKAQNAVKSNIRENRRRLTSSYLSTGILVVMIVQKQSIKIDNA